MPKTTRKVIAAMTAIIMSAATAATAIATTAVSACEVNPTPITEEPNYTHIEVLNAFSMECVLEGALPMETATLDAALTDDCMYAIILTGTEGGAKALCAYAGNGSFACETLTPEGYVMEAVDIYSLGYQYLFETPQEETTEYVERIYIKDEDGNEVFRQESFDGWTVFASEKAGATTECNLEDGNYTLFMESGYLDDLGTTLTATNVSVEDGRAYRAEYLASFRRVVSCENFDFNADGKVSVVDAVSVKKSQTTNTNICFDTNADGVSDEADVTAVMEFIIAS